MEHTLQISHIVAGIIALLLIASLTLALTERIKLPFTVALVVIGMLLAELGEQSPQTLGPLADLKISSGLILYVFLPALVFESAFHLDARLLQRDIASVMMLAVPGLLLSTALIGLVVAAATPIPLAPALLLGAILSATDPVAVIALFKRLGAPRRLTVLVEGESLFNDATSIVLAGVMVGILTAGSFSTDTLVGGVVHFITVFTGGLVVGWVLALLTGYLLAVLPENPFIQITLTTILAYLSFIIAEEVFHLSGVMAVVAAALTFSGWGWIKVTASARSYLEYFWEYMAFIATALIFLMVGLKVELAALLDSMDLLVWVVAGMLLARAVVVWGLLPLVQHLPGAQPVEQRYRSVIYWGGLRGAIALAIVLSLPAFEYTGVFTTLVMGAVLFTLLVQGLTIDPLVHRLQLDRPPLADRFAMVEGNLLAKERSRSRIPELLAGGLFSGSIAERLQVQSDHELLAIKQELDQLRQLELTPDEERRLLYMRSFSEEQSLFIDMFNKGHISETTFRRLRQFLGLHLDAVRFASASDGAVFPQARHRARRWDLLKFLARMTPLRSFVEQLRTRRVASDYELSWGRCQSCGSVLEQFDALVETESISPEIAGEVRDQYQAWYASMRSELDGTAEQFPEFVAAMQERLGQRLLLLAELEAIMEQAEHGTLQEGIAETIEHELGARLSRLRGFEVERLRVEPEELLRKVPFFAEIPAEEFAQLSARMRSRTLAKGDDVIRQGETDDSLFLIVRGVVRVIREDGAESHELATLMAGDFFGEMALLDNAPRNATVRAMTPCVFYELRRKDIPSIMREYHHKVRCQRLAIELPCAGITGAAHG